MKRPERSRKTVQHAPYGQAPPTAGRGVNNGADNSRGPIRLVAKSPRLRLICAHWFRREPTTSVATMAARLLRECTSAPRVDLGVSPLWPTTPEPS
jgi:hypothetical protein